MALRRGPPKGREAERLVLTENRCRMCTLSIVTSIRHLKPGEWISKRREGACGIDEGATLLLRFLPSRLIADRRLGGDVELTSCH